MIGSQFAINAKQSLKLEKSSKYNEYLKFIQKEGGMWSKIDFPQCFGDIGYIGIASKEQIQSNQVIMMIPNNLLISYFKVRDHEVLGKILTENDEFFDPIDNAFGDYHSLILYVLHERMLGEKSFFYRVFQVTDQSYTLKKWRFEEVQSLKDQYLMDQFEEYLQGNNSTQIEFRRLLKQYENLFQFKNDEDYERQFQWAADFVMTRRMQISEDFKFTFLVPLADFVNHGQDLVRFHLVNLELEQKPFEFSKDFYQYYSNYFDFSLFQQVNSAMEKQKSKAQLEESKNTRAETQLLDEKQIEFILIFENQGVIEQKEIQKLQEIQKKLPFAIQLEDAQFLDSMINTCNYRNFLKEPAKNIWDFNFFDDLNEFDEEDFQQEEQKKNDHDQFENLLESKVFERLEQINQEQNPVCLDENFNVIEARAPNESDETVKPGKVEQNQNTQYIHDFYNDLQMDDEYEEIQEVKEVKQPQVVMKNDSKFYQKEKEKETEKQQLSQREEELKRDLDKYAHHTNKKLNQGQYDWFVDNSRDAYMMVCSDYAIQGGQQILNLYGRKNNKNLLLYYGFCLANNQYDRFMFRIAMTAESYEEFVQKINNFIIDNYIKSTDEENYEFLFTKQKTILSIEKITKEFKIQNNRFSDEFVLFLRTYRRHMVSNGTNSEAAGIVSFSQQLEVIDIYRKIIEYFLQLKNIDYGKLQNTPNQQYIINYNNSLVQILKSHHECCLILLDINLALQQLKPPITQEKFKSLYLEKRKEFINFQTFKQVKKYLKSLFQFCSLLK